jgi:hypothetical protein
MLIEETSTGPSKRNEICLYGVVTIHMVMCKNGTPILIRILLTRTESKHIQASCRMEDAEGLDAENVGFLNLALQEVRQTVTEEIQAWMMGVAAMAEMD